MWKLRERLKDQKGFTLVEMLIVVAFIGILIAVSIPMVTGTLEKARHAVDDANFRDAAALGSIEYLQDPDNAAGTYTYYTNKAQQGVLVKSTGTPAGGYTQYTAQCTGGTSDCESGRSGAKLQVEVAGNGDVTVTWKI